MKQTQSNCHLLHKRHGSGSFIRNGLLLIHFFTKNKGLCLSFAMKTIHPFLSVFPLWYKMSEIKTVMQSMILKKTDFMGTH